MQAQTTNSNNLTVLGYVDATNDIFYGNAVSGGVTNSAVSLNYSDALHEVGLLSSQPSSIFLWQDNGIGTSSNKMKLDGSNNLTLYSTNGSNGIVLNPTTGGLQLKGTGAGITLVDGTLINSSNSLHSSGLYNSSGTEVASVDANGNLDINSPVQIAGSGNGINFANGSTLNAGNVAYLNQTLTNLGYHPTTLPSDAAYTFPSNFSVIKVAVDGSGNAYVTGTFTGSGSIGATTLSAVGNQDVFVVKVGATGSVQWAESFGGAGGTDNPNGIAVDGSGNVYVVGNFTQSITSGLNSLTLTDNLQGSEEFVIKYNSTGSVTWATGFGGGNDWPAGVAVDGNGNVDVFGWYNSPITTGVPQTLTDANGEDEFLIQFNPSHSGNGGAVWAEKFGAANDDWPAGIAVDGVGNIDLFGYFQDVTKIGNQFYYENQGADEFVVKYNPSGALGWVSTFGGGSDTPVGIAVDGNGNPYVTGQYYSPVSTGLPSGQGLSGGAESGNSDNWFVVKFNSSSGGVTWAKGFGGGFYPPAPQAIAVDQSGNAFVTGQNYGSFNAGQSSPLNAVNPSGDLVLVQFNPSGGISWATDIATTGGYVYSQALAVNPTEGLALLGFASGNFDLGGQAVNFGPFVYLGSESSLETPVNEATPNFAWGGSRASGNGAVALGTYASASSQGAVALGDGVSSANYSFSAGYDTAAQGYGSTAFGSSNSAAGSDATAFGASNSAIGNGATAFGATTYASGLESLAFGIGTKADSYLSVAFGQYNVGLVGSTNGVSGNGIWIPTDPILEIGNGSSDAPSDAVTVFKNGNLRTVGTVEAVSGVRIPQTGDMNMGSFTNGNSPTNLTATNGLTYPGGN